MFGRANYHIFVIVWKIQKKKKTILTSVSSSFNLVNRSSFPLVGKYLASAGKYGKTATAVASATNSKTGSRRGAIGNKSGKTESTKKKKMIKITSNSSRNENDDV